MKRWYHVWTLFESHIPATTGGFELPVSNPSVVTESCDPNNSQAWHHSKLKPGLKLKCLNILIPSYIRYSSGLTEPKCHKTKHYLVVWLKHLPRLTFENWVLKTIFYFTKSFLKRNVVSAPRHIFFWSPNFLTDCCPLSRKRGGNTLSNQISLYQLNQKCVKAITQDFR